MEIVQEEIWKDLGEIECYKEFKGLYLISTLGRMLNLKTGKFIKLQYPKRLNCKTSNNRKNIYPTYSIRIHGKCKNVGLHRVLALAFVKLPEGYSAEELDVNHIDGDKLNFRLSNLEWLTPRQNLQHAYKNGLMHNNGVCVECKIFQFDLNENYLNTFNSVYEASEATKTEAGNIYKVCHNERFNAGGFHWQFEDPTLAKLPKKERKAAA